MADTIREQIIQALVAKLEAVTEANGYSMTAGAVLRGPRQVDVDALPAITVWDQDEQTVPGYGHLALAMTVLIETFSEGCPTGIGVSDDSQRGNQSIGDIKRAVLSGDDTLGGLADSIGYQGGTIVYPEGGQTTVATEQRITITYTERRGAPDQPAA